LIDIYSVSSNKFVHSAIGKDPPQKLGMTMCLGLASKKNDSSQLILVAGYESGHVCVYDISSSSWSTMYSFKAHSQPALSIAIHPSQESFYTTSADANLIQHPIALASQAIKSANTKHSGQTSINVREDGRILVTAGWDGNGRVYSSTTLKQVAVLKWHVGGLQVAGFSKQRRWIILGGKDAKITLWDVFT
jgi:ASTRA-associated protein 1